ncbi:LysR family transcriptional regulator [Clostridium botulinum]|nr:LysR family transcriptional regulator [Clostridium botulinum]
MNNTGGLIVAAGKIDDNGGVSPLFQIGSISIIKRIILTFQQAKISPIVVITGYQSLEVEQHLADYEVIFLKNENYDSTEKFDSAKIGLNFLKDKCKQVVFTSATIPMYTSNTLSKLIKTDKQLIVPSYKGRAGHPLLINCNLITKIVEYNGREGMRGAINSIGIIKEYLEVEDEGIILEADEIEKLDGVLQYYNDKLLHPFIRISIEKESLFFNSRAKLLLLLIQETHSVKRACKHMALSYGKAWNMLNEMEKSLGYNVVERRHGGRRGGKTNLTLEGEDFLEKYQRYEDDIRQYASKRFYDIFKEVK